MKKHICIFLTVLFAACISVNAVAREEQLFNSDIYIDQNKITIGDPSGTTTTTFNQEAQRLEVQMPTNDGTSYFDIEDSAGLKFFTINSDGQLQSQLTYGFEFIDPFTLADEVFFNNTHTISFDTNNTDNLLATWKSSGVWNFDFQGDNDGSSGVYFINSDDLTWWRTYSDGHLEMQNNTGSTSTFIDRKDFAGQGGSGVLYSYVDHIYAERSAIYRIDSTSQTGYFLDLRNANNDVNRPDLTPGTYGQTGFLQFGDSSGVIYQYTKDGDENWNKNSARNFNYNFAAGQSYVQQWRAYGVNTADFRWRNPTGYVDFATWDNAGEDGLEYVAGVTTLGGLRMRVVNGEFNILANENVEISSATGDIIIDAGTGDDIFMLDTLDVADIRGGEGAGDDLTLSSTSNATKGNINFGVNSTYDEVNDRLGIGTTTPDHELSVIGNAEVTGSSREGVTTVAAATYTIASDDKVIVVDYTTTGAVTLTLPSASSVWDATNSTGARYVIKDLDANAGTNNITIQRNATPGTDTIIDTAAAQTSTAITTDGGAIEIMAVSSSEWIVF